MGIAQDSGFAPRSMCGAGSDVLSMPQRDLRNLGAGICNFNWEKSKLILC